MNERVKEFGITWIRNLRGNPSCVHELNMREFYHFIKEAIESGYRISEFDIKNLVEEFHPTENEPVWTPEMAERLNENFFHRYEDIYGYLSANDLIQYN